MAELLAGTGWAEPGSVGAYLRDGLPDEYVAVVEPTVYGCPVDMIVIGPQALFVLYVRDWEGEVYPATSGPWRERRGDGHQVRHPNPARVARRTEAAVRAFLRDEFPTCQPRIIHLLVLTDPRVRIMGANTTIPPVVKKDMLAEVIASVPPAPDAPAMDAQLRESLGTALRDRQLTSSQRAGRPFVFRSGTLFRSGTQVWTIRAAVRHMDRHPEDGIFHLRNGTLAGWLAEQGAPHLANLAREVMRKGEADARVALETFLIGTGLVSRPRLKVQPRRLDLGWVLSGDSRQCRLRISKGHGRGYLFGSLRSLVPWVHVEPRSLRGGPLEAIVRVETQTLPISPTPCEGAIQIESSASEKPITLPVRARVMGVPSALNRRLLRPLAGFVSTGLLGAGLGWAWANWGIPPSEQVMRRLPEAISYPVACALLLGLFWAVLGWIRAARQPLTWPTPYALARWLTRLVVWGIAFCLLAVAGYWLWAQFNPDLRLALDGGSLLPYALAALMPSSLPATVAEVRAARAARSAQVPLLGGLLKRPLLVTVLGIVLEFLVILGVVLLRPALQGVTIGEAAEAAQVWLTEHWTRMESDVDKFLQQVFPQYRYQTPMPGTPVAQPSPTAAGSMP